MNRDRSSVAIHSKLPALLKKSLISFHKMNEANVAGFFYTVFPAIS
jgi:hypothetical protein